MDGAGCIRDLVSRATRVFISILVNTTQHYMHVTTGLLHFGLFSHLLAQLECALSSCPTSCLSDLLLLFLLVLVLVLVLVLELVLVRMHAAVPSFDNHGHVHVPL